ncbi:hypothetical protein ABT404_51040, partial [Streptomyces hyaluromycini]
PKVRQAISYAVDRSSVINVVGVAELAHPDLVLVGGGFGTGVPGYVPAVAARVRQLTRPGARPVPVAPAALGGLSSLDGALLLAGETFGRALAAG